MKQGTNGWVPITRFELNKFKPAGHHRTMGCVLLMSNAITIGKLLYSRARSLVGKS